MPGLPPTTALYCMQIWTISFSNTAADTYADSSICIFEPGFHARRMDKECVGDTYGYTCKTFRKNGNHSFNALEKFFYAV